jgi:hypothetical protein
VLCPGTAGDGQPWMALEPKSGGQRRRFSTNRPPLLLVVDTGNNYRQGLKHIV